ncbi:unnamed protein product, partial [marine sediment metagenome]
AEICVEIRNPTSEGHDMVVNFAWANFGIGLPFTPINGPRLVHLPPHSMVKECLYWVPPVSGQVCLEITLEMEGYEPLKSQRNVDVNEPLQPGVKDQLTFPVGNPYAYPVDISLGIVPHKAGWGIEIDTDVLLDVGPDETRFVTLSVTPPADAPVLTDGELIVDVEAFVEGALLSGFRKVFRPPVPLHVSPDPPYAEREISVFPYPVMVGVPTEICVELRNPTSDPQDVVVHFAWANFGIGLPFTPIDGPRLVHLPPHSLVKECLHWVPP